ncbi:hypothetical protein [Breoghania sp.]|uniref:hypothetical protein n=1 Tax=Breoghania sp. TaxID=2065378 RepID=UPI002625F13C|nr:hypothetical protein [Breoghania sp.]MDJ0931409.1 hypothetical protein [Breoghania sp.]
MIHRIWNAYRRIGAKSGSGRAEGSGRALKHLAALCVVVLLAGFVGAVFAVDPVAGQSSIRPPVSATLPSYPGSPSSIETHPDLRRNPTQGHVPGGVLGTSSDADLWRKMRSGVSGTVSIPDKKAVIVIQSEGDNWRAFRNGPLSTYGA